MLRDLTHRVAQVQVSLEEIGDFDGHRLRASVHAELFRLPFSEPIMFTKLFANANPDAFAKLD